MSRKTRNIISAITVLAAIVFGIIELAQGSSDTTSRTPSTTSATAPPTATTASPSTPGAAPTRASTLSTVAVRALPNEARDTLARIARGGPYPYRQDDGVFQNREGILPARAGGYYREYTVVTPGSPDRGARRIIVGADGDRYYTDDHYASFREIVDA